MKLLLLPLGALLVLVFFYPEMWILGVPVFVLAISADIYSTTRFGKEMIIRHEANGILRRLVKRFGIRTGMALQLSLYVILLATLPYMMHLHAGNVDYFSSLGIWLFGLGGGHVWAASRNTMIYERWIQRQA